MDIDDKIIIVSGMPRSGSTWTYNVLRHLIRISGRRPLPEKIPPDQNQLLEKAFSAPAGPGRVYCIKSHCGIRVDREDVRIFCNVRDVRDVTLSYMRFMKSSFEHALDVARNCMGITDYFLGRKNPYIYPVDYDDIAMRPDNLIEGMAEFLGVAVTKQQTLEIADAYSRSRLKAQQEKMQVRPTGKAQPGSPDVATPYLLMRYGDGSIEYYDPETGFQSHHIASEHEGEWRHVLTEEQKEILNKLAHDWLVRYGYQI